MFFILLHRQVRIGQSDSRLWLDQAALCTAVCVLTLTFYFCTLKKTISVAHLPSSMLALPNRQTRLIYYGWVVCCTHKQELFTGFYQYDYSLKSLLHLSNDCSVFIFGRKKNLFNAKVVCS